MFLVQRRRKIPLKSDVIKRNKQVMEENKLLKLQLEEMTRKNSPSTSTPNQPPDPPVSQHPPSPISSSSSSSSSPRFSDSESDTEEITNTVSV